MPHEYNNEIHKSNIRLWMKHKQKLNDIHPASPGCRPGTYPTNNEEAEQELATNAIKGLSIPSQPLAKVSRPRCDPILNELEGPTKDRSAS